MVTLDQYLKGILIQILDSYKKIVELKDKSGDLEIIKVEWLKIHGLLLVLVNKGHTKKSSDDFTNLLNSAKHYLGNYEFEREINTMSLLYNEDPNRLKNIRFKIMESLNDKKLIEKIESIKNEL